MAGRPDFNGLLVLPHIRVQNANAVSSPLTWGFPAMTAFLGLMWALERKTAAECELAFQAVGVICHAFEPQVSRAGYTRAFCLTRNPVNDKGETAAIVEEGRAHLEISLIFAVTGAGLERDEANRVKLANLIQEALGGLRLAGGSMLPSGPKIPPRLELLDIDSEDRYQQLRQLRRQTRLIPGYALVARPDCLALRRAELRTANLPDSPLEAWLDLARLNWRPERSNPGDGPAKITWPQTRAKDGWLVPLPVGYAAISPLYKVGEVKNARDESTPFRFVESLYSVGEWIGAHRFRDIREVLWYAHQDETNGLYLCLNDFKPATTGE
ncbi:type I-F CRISPR-associated protein Csy2 [Deltaproteobacteria bacterium]|nr:type I-F CRISPR-associated protein Csy2 [Deltaproteobacteria bacterium]